MYPPPFGNLSLLDPPTPRKFHDPPWGGGGVWIFSGTTHYTYMQMYYEEGQRPALCYSTGEEAKGEEKTRLTQNNMEEND